MKTALADCCDGFGGAYLREDVLRIMRDSHIGVFGAIGLIVALLLKWQVLAALPVARIVWISIAAHAASRAMAISFLFTHDYVRIEGKARAVAHKPGPAALVLIALSGLPWLFWPDWRLGLLTFGMLAAVRFGLGAWFRRRIGGYTAIASALRNRWGRSRSICVRLPGGPSEMGGLPHGWMAVRDGDRFAHG